MAEYEINENVLRNYQVLGPEDLADMVIFDPSTLHAFIQALIREYRSVKLSKNNLERDNDLIRKTIKLRDDVIDELNACLNQLVDWDSHSGDAPEMLSDCVEVARSLTGRER